MGQHTHNTLVDGVEVDVTFEVESYGYPSNHWDDPGEGMEFFIVGAFKAGTLTEVLLTDGQRERIEGEICEIDPNELNDGYDD